jgi:hypothetical protein
MKNVTVIKAKQKKKKKKKEKTRLSQTEFGD